MHVDAPLMRDAGKLQQRILVAYDRINVNPLPGVRLQHARQDYPRLLFNKVGYVDLGLVHCLQESDNVIRLRHKRKHPWKRCGL